MVTAVSHHRWLEILSVRRSSVFLLDNGKAYVAELRFDGELWAEHVIDPVNLLLNPQWEGVRTFHWLAVVLDAVFVF